MSINLKIIMRREIARRFSDPSTRDLSVAAHPNHHQDSEYSTYGEGRGRLFRDLIESSHCPLCTCRS
jgi:hypothetical protein